MPSTRFLAVAALVISIIAYRSGSLFQNAILTRSSFPTGYFAGGDYAADCTTLKDPDGSDDLKYCEDTTFWELHNPGPGMPDERRVLLSCDANRKSWNTVMGPLRNPDPRGSLWLYTPNSPSTGAAAETPIQKVSAKVFKNVKRKSSTEPKPQRITLEGYPDGHDFHPLGLEIYPSYAGNASNLYVVNHARERTTIEQFLLSPSNPTAATYIRTLTSPYFISPNALALTGPDSFYVSNDHLFTRRLPIIGHFVPLLESVLAIPLAFVSHITLNPPSSPTPIKDHFFAAPFIPLPNGIALSPSGDNLAIVSTSLGEVYIYTRDPATNRLKKHTHTIHVPFCGDNIHYVPGSPDTLVLGGHPNFIDLGKVAANKPGSLAPSWVVKIRAASERDNQTSFDLAAPISVSSKVAAGNDWTVETLFESDGSVEGFSSSTTGLVDPDTGALYVTGLYDERGMLVCRPST